MSKDIMLVSSVPTFMMNDLQQEYVLHDHAHILTKVTAFVGVGSTAKVDRKLLATFPNVKMISIFGVGYDGIDVAAVKERGIQVTHTPDVLTDDVADLAMGLILSIGRRIPQSDKFVRNGDWVSEPFT
ncbi:MAG: 2-hydroxyacid dehydrogenase, partial [Betaproteobacteria bacterium]|nr:2-hydroxyacid dehydrogenase [Betaproteobacteria bacterium]